jgi:oleandomycin transport system ATP-binding protein
VRRTIGQTCQYASVDEFLSGAENLYMIGRLLDLSAKQAKARAAELLERFSLTEAAKRPAKTYSGGMRRRLDLAASMMGRPRVLYLDEPTTGLDPRTRNEVWEEVQRMVADGATVLLTTQYMEEAEQLATDLTVIDRGQVIASGTVDGLKRQIGGQTLQVRPSRPGELPEMARCLTERGISSTVTDTDLLAVPIIGDEQLTEVIGLLGGRGFGVAGIDTVVPSLDEVFLTLTNKPAAAQTTATQTTATQTAAPRTVEETSR